MKCVGVCQEVCQEVLVCETCVWGMLGGMSGVLVCETCVRYARRYVRRCVGVC